MSLDVLILLGSGLVLAAVLSTRFADRTGVPALVLFVVLGMLAGTSGPGGVAFADYELSLHLGFLALAVILFSGGLDTDARLFRRSLVPGGALATIGVGLSATVLGCAAWALTPLTFLESLLLGAVLAPTDAAAVFSVLKGKGLPERIEGVLETESSTNDPVSVYFAVAMTTALGVGGAPIGAVLGGIALQLGLGAVVGFLSGWGLTALIQRTRVSSHGLYPVMALAGALGSYALANLVGGNGFLAVFLCGLELSRRGVAYRRSIREFVDSVAWGAQIAMFLVLGLLSFPERLVTHLGLGVVLAGFGLLVARPIAVAATLSLTGTVFRSSRFTWREHLLVSWAGLRGAVPIILAIVPLLAGLPSAEFIFDVVFVVVIVGTLVQGRTVGWVARRLELLSEPPPPAPTIELRVTRPHGDVGDALYEYLEPDHPAVGKTLQSLALPDGVRIAAIGRGDTVIAPTGATELAAGDHVWFVTGSDAESRLTDDAPPC